MHSVQLFDTKSPLPKIMKLKQPLRIPPIPVLEHVIIVVLYQFLVPSVLSLLGGCVPFSRTRPEYMGVANTDGWQTRKRAKLSQLIHLHVQVSKINYFSDVILFPAQVIVARV